MPSERRRVTTSLLLLGQHFRLDFGDAELTRDGVGGGAVVAGQHDDADAFGAERGERRGRRLPDGVGDADHTGDLAARSRRRSRWRRRARRRVGLGGPIADGDVRVGEVAGVADEDRLALDHARDALAGCGVGTTRRREGEAALVGRADDGRAERVLAAALEACGEPEQFVLVDALGGEDRGHRRLALGQGAGLVDDERVDLLEPLQRLGVLDEEAEARALADADHDRHRRREAEGTGTGDDQDRDGGDEGVGKRGFGSEDPPRRQRRRGRSTITSGTNQPET